MSRRNSSLAAFFFLLMTTAARAATVEHMAEGYFGYTLLGWIRRHPGTTFLLFAGALVVLFIVTLIVVRRVKAEAHGYAVRGRTVWNNARERFTHIGHHELPSQHITTPHDPVEPKETENEEIERRRRGVG